MQSSHPVTDGDIDTIVVFTARSPERIVREGGSQAWVLNPVRAKQATWLVCTQNRHNPDHEFSDATESHGSGFLVGKVSSIVRSNDVRPDERNKDRWLVAISEYATIDRPGMWDGSRNPVRYTTLKQLGIRSDELQFQPMPGTIAQSPGPGRVRRQTASARMTTIADAKKALAATFGVDPEAIEITIRG